MRKLLKRMSPARIIALGFAAAIFIGSGLLMLPCSVQNGVDLKYIDALYTSASAVCVTVCLMGKISISALAALTDTALSGAGESGTPKRSV